MCTNNKNNKKQQLLNHSNQFFSLKLLGMVVLKRTDSLLFSSSTCV